MNSIPLFKVSSDGCQSYTSCKRVRFQWVWRKGFLLCKKEMAKAPSTNALFCLKCRGESLETFLQKGVAAAAVVVIMYQKNLL